MRQPHSTACMLGRYTLAAGLLASPTEPIAAEARTVMKIKVHDALADMERSDSPSRESWRNLADAMNFLQSCSELKWIEDKDGAIEAAKGALLEGHSNAVNKGKLRVGGISMDGLRNLGEQFCDLIDAMSARMYWSAVRATEKRISGIWRGKVKAGDVVVSL